MTIVHRLVMRKRVLVLVALLGIGVSAALFNLKLRCPELAAHAQNPLSRAIAIPALCLHMSLKERCVFT